MVCHCFPDKVDGKSAYSMASQLKCIQCYNHYTWHFQLVNHRDWLLVNVTPLRECSDIRTTCNYGALHQILKNTHDNELITENS